MIQRLITYIACLLGIFMVGCASNKISAPIENLAYQPPSATVSSTDNAVEDDSASGVTTATVNPATSVPVTVTSVATTSVVSSHSNASWIMPSSGTIIRKFGAGYKGVDFTAAKGSPIVATAAGRVIYAGNGLKKYGNLIIIKHDNNYLSAYAYNDTMLVKAEDKIEKGQQIATMGIPPSGNKQALLHFEIRKNGTPIDPLPLIRSI